MRSRTPAPAPEPIAAKVPAIGVLFWIIKLTTTGVGESTSDFLGNTNVALAGVIGVFGFAAALRWQLRAPEYRAPTYWIAVLMVAVFGTMVADGLRDGAGISYATTTVFYAVAVAALFVAWYRSEGTLSIHSIDTRRRERFYWVTVLATFALGTAAGDWTAVQLHLGFFGSALLFAGVIAIPAVAWWTGALNPIAAFWSAYVVTRPLGASIADWLGKPQHLTGVGLGDGLVTAAGLVAFAGLVAYVTRTRGDIQPHRHEPHHAHGAPQIGLRPQPAES